MLYRLVSVKTISLVVVVTLCALVYLDASQSAHRWISLGKPFVGPPKEYVYSPPQIEKHFTAPDAERKDYHEWNAQTLRELHACMILDNCGVNQRKVALLASHWFEEATVRGWRGGEGIWGMSIYKNMRILGYTTFFANSFDEALYLYRMMPDLVKVVMRNWPRDCHNNPKCVKGPTNPSGIPAWKIFDFEFFPSYGSHDRASMLGGKWILSANPDHRVKPGEPSPIQYIGYSIEDECTKIPVIPLAERKNQVWMLMKQLTFVYDHRFTWNRSYFARAASELSIDFVGGWQIDQHYQWDPEEKGIMTDIEDPEHGVTNLGQLVQAEFIKELGMSKVLLGMGNPFWSPSPYNALCQGVPFINPIITWDKKDPWNRSRWQCQHPSLTYIEEPWVYHVHAHNYSGMIDAIKATMQTKVGRFIPDHMTEQALRKRLVELMETDWKAKAAILLENNIKKGGDAYIFEL